MMDLLLLLLLLLRKVALVSTSSILYIALGNA